MESHLNKNLAFQIRALRDQVDWTQHDLARRVGMNQNAISRLENPNYGKATLTTLKRIAAAFDVAIVVRFVPFSQLANWVSGTPFVDNGLSSTSLRVLNFSQENRAMQQRARELGSIPERALTRTAELELGSLQDYESQIGAVGQAGSDKQRAA